MEEGVEEDPVAGEAASPLDDEAMPSTAEEQVLWIPLPDDARTGRVVCERSRLGLEASLQISGAHVAAVRANLIQRAQILERCVTDFDYRTHVLELCRRDPVFFINYFGWTFDDRARVPTMPLVLYPKQAESVADWKMVYVDSAEMDSITLFDEKSRAWGWTWVFATWCRVWTFLFKPGWTTLFGHDKEEKLDDGGLAATHQTTFGKIRFALRRLPDWMLPENVWDPRTNKICQIQNQTNGNILKGEFYSANFGRGDRYSDIVGDEVCASDKFGAAETSFKQTSRRAHLGTTPRGMDNDAARLRHGRKKKIVRTLHWTDNPTLDAAWYWRQREQYTAEQAAQELDISWTRSAGGRIFKSFDRTKVVGDFDYDPNLPLVVSIDPGFDDPCAILWIQPDKAKRQWRIVDFLHINNRPGEFFVPFFLGRIPDQTIFGKPWPWRYDHNQREMIERHGIWRPIDEAMGGADGAAVNVVTGTDSLFALWESYGVPYVYPVSLAGRAGNKDNAIRMVEIALPRIRIARRLEEQRTGGASTPTIVQCFEQYAWVDRSQIKTGRKQKREPRHDQYCHPMDALQIYLWHEDVVDPQNQPVRREGGAVVYDPDLGLPVRPAVQVVGQEEGPG